MDAAPPSTPPARIPVTPPPWRRNNPQTQDHHNLRAIFIESEYEIITKKCNSQLVKAWIYFYRLCLKDPLTFALVK